MSSKRAVPYCRVAIESPDSLHAQEESCRAIAEAEGLEVTSVYSDVGPGQAAMRQGLLNLLADLAENPGTAVVVERLDRLARDSLFLKRVIEMIWENGGYVVSRDQILLNDEDGQNFSQFLVARSVCEGTDT